MATTKADPPIQIARVSKLNNRTARAKRLREIATKIENGKVKQGIADLRLWAFQENPDTK